MSDGTKDAVSKMMESIEAIPRFELPTYETVPIVPAYSPEREERDIAISEATAKTAQHVESLDTKVRSIETRLENEKTKREKADNKNSTLAILGVVFGGIGAAAGLIALFR